MLALARVQCHQDRLARSRRATAMAFLGLPLNSSAANTPHLPTAAALASMCCSQAASACLSQHRRGGRTYDRLHCCPCLSGSRVASMAAWFEGDQKFSLLLLCHHPKITPVLPQVTDSIIVLFIRCLATR